MRFTSQTWTAMLSAVLFVGCALVLAMAPVPFVGWAPGTAYPVLGTADRKPLVQIDGARTYPVSGTLSLTTVSVTRVDANLSLPEAVFDYWMPKREVLPRYAVYRAGTTAGEVQAEERQMMDTSQDMAVVAALREADISLTPMPVVSEVISSGPANGQLLPGDLIEAIDGKTPAGVEGVGDLIREHTVGEKVVFTVLRDRKQVTVTITTRASNEDAERPVVGIMVQDGFAYDPRVSFGIDPEIGGPSAGLVFALATYLLLTPEDLLNGRNVAGTGTIDYEGNVGAIGGIQEKIAGAEKRGATIFLVPAANCGDVAGVETDMALVKVATLRSALDALENLEQPATAGEVERCG